MRPPDEHDQLDPNVEALLRRSTPSSAIDFTQGLERRLFEKPASAPRRRPQFLRPVVAGGALASTLAAVAGAFALAGSGPFAGSDDGAQAEDHCRYVPERRIERVPRVVTDVSGEPRIRYTRRRVTVQVRRCR